MFLNRSCSPYIQERNHLYKFGREHNEKHFLSNYFEFGPVVQKMLFKDILSTAVVAYTFGKEKLFMQFSRVHYDKHFCVQNMSFKDISYL